MSYIRFAKEESQFFKYLFIRNRAEEKFDEMEFEFQAETSVLTNLYNIKGNLASQLHIHMWVWVHGIATMFATGYLTWEWQTVSEMLTDAFMGIKQRLEK